MRVERALPTDVHAIEALLAASHLPLDGAAGAFATGVVARDDTAVVGAAAIEPHGDAGLLRSVVVAPELRGTGVGANLLASAEALAGELGIGELYLLTETAEAWFARRGYERLDRDDVPERVRRSVEFVTACSDKAVAMKRRLGS